MKDFFSFNRKERNGLFVLLSIIVIIECYNLYTKLYHVHDPIHFTELVLLKEDEKVEVKKHVEKINKEFRPKTKGNKISNKFRTQVDFKALPLIDLNSLDQSLLKEYKLPPWLIKNWINYKATGAKFHNESDLSKIYGMDSLYLNRIKSQVIYDVKNEKIKAQNTPNIVMELEKEESKNSPTKIVNVNSANAETLKSIKGIGDVFSKRILKYRDLIGGFYDKEQIKDVYGITDSIYAAIEFQIEVDASIIKKYCVIESDVEELSQQFFITKKMATQIKYYIIENEKGSASFEELMGIKGMWKEKLSKAEPYLILSEYKTE